MYELMEVYKFYGDFVFNIYLIFYSNISIYVMYMVCKDY